MNTLGRSCVLTLAASSPTLASAQVTVEWERNHARAVQAFGIDACIEVPGGGLWATGMEYRDGDQPGLDYVGGIPVFMRLDGDGQLLSATPFAIPFDPGSPPGSIVRGELGQVYVPYLDGSIHVQCFGPDGSPAWSREIPNSAALVPGGLGSRPGGGFSIVTRQYDGAFAVAQCLGDGSNLILGGLTVPVTSSSFVATVGASGRVACVLPNPTRVRVSQPTNLLLAWQRNLEFTPLAMAFGAGDELVVAGRQENPSRAVVRVHESNGVVRFTHVAPPGPSSEYRAVAIDRFGAIAVTGVTNATSAADGADGLTTMLAADGSVLWSRTWAGPAGFDDEFTKILVTQSGGVRVAGQTHLTSVAPYPTNERRLLVVAYDRAGNESWTHVDPAVGTQTETCSQLLETSTGAIVSAGTRWNQNVVNSGYTPIGGHLLALRPQSRSLCFGDAQSAACPCGNASAPGEGRGCSNSSGSAARLVDSGIASLSNDTLVLTVDGTTPHASGLYFQGTITTTPTAFGDGLRCTGGSSRRLDTRPAVGGVSSVPAPGNPSLSARSAAAGDVLAPGTTRIYQVVYRDLGASFCPPPSGGNQNTSSALAIHWTL